MRPRLVALPLALLSVSLALLTAAPADAQREFVEEVERGDPSLDDVDLDAPDPAERGPRKPKPDAGPAGAGAGTGRPPGTTPGSTPGTPGAPGTPGTPSAGAAGTSSTLPGTGAPGTGPGTAPPTTAPGTAPPGTGPPGTTLPVPPDPTADDPSGIRVIETSYDALLEKWDTRAAVVRSKEVAKARKLLGPSVDDALLDFGVQGVPGGFNAPAVASALISEGKRALEDGSVDEALALVEVAERAAPDLVAVHAMRARVAWVGGDLGGALNALVDSLRTYARDPLALSQLTARAIVLAGAVAVALLVLFALLAGLPALRYLSFDLLQALPRGAAGGQVLALVVMAALAPLVVGAGPVFGALWILSLAWLYVTRRERIVIGIVAAFALALPFAVDAAARLIAYPGSRADKAQRAMFDANAEPLRVALAKRAPDELDVWEKGALAYAAKREGRLEDARKRWEELALARPELSWVHAELGVVAALSTTPGVGGEEMALNELGKALGADNKSWASAFNSSIIHFRKGRTDKAEGAVAPVAKAQPTLLNIFRRTTYRAPDQVVGHNRAFIDVYPRPLELLEVGLAPSKESAAVADAVSRPLLRGQVGTRALAFLAAFPLAWLVLLALKKRIGPAQACVRCGHPASSRVDGKDVPADTCAQCFHAFVSTRSRIDAGVKLRKEREIISRRTRLGRSIVALGVLWPGAGHIYGGAPVSGLVFATLHAFALGGLVFAKGLVPMPRLPGPWPETMLLVVVGAFAAIVWLVSLRSTWMLAQDASGRGRR